MRTEYVTVDVTYVMSVDVADDATAADVLEAAERRYSEGELGIIDDHTIDPNNDWGEADADAAIARHDRTYGQQP